MLCPPCLFLVFIFGKLWIDYISFLWDKGGKVGGGGGGDDGGINGAVPGKPGRPGRKGSGKDLEFHNVMLCVPYSTLTEDIYI